MGLFAERSNTDWIPFLGVLSTPKEELWNVFRTVDLRLVDKLGEIGLVVGILAILGTPRSPQLSKTLLSSGKALNINSSFFSFFLVWVSCDTRLGWFTVDFLANFVLADKVVRVFVLLAKMEGRVAVNLLLTSFLLSSGLRASFGRVIGLVSRLLAFNCWEIRRCLSSNSNALWLGSFLSCVLFPFFLTKLCNLWWFTLEWMRLLCFGGVLESNSLSERMFSFQSSVSSSLELSYSSLFFVSVSTS